MWNEIKEQPAVIDEIFNRYFPKDKEFQNLNIEITKAELEKISQIYIVASGSSRNAGNIAKYFIEKTVKIPVKVDYASEFAHRDPCLSKNDLVIAISQSGETADTFAALNVAIDKGAYTLAITNNINSKIHESAKYKMYISAGKEISIAATKSFTAQLICLFILGLYLGKIKETINNKDLYEYKKNFYSLKENLSVFIEESNYNLIIEKIKSSKSIVCIGRSQNYAVAQEGALKIKETSYIDANGYPSGEFLHGYLAVVDKEIPVISIISSKKNNEKNYVLSIKNIEEIKKKRNPDFIIIKSIDDNEIKNNKLFENDYFIDVPIVSDECFTIYSVIALQILAYKLAIKLDRDINNPRSLTKAVTSE